MQVAQPTPSESELSRYAKLDSAAREHGGSGRSVFSASVLRFCNASVSRRARSMRPTCKAISFTADGITKTRCVLYSLG